MDPDANIATQRDLITRLRTDPGDQDARNQLTELSQALLTWLASGGFPPATPDWIKVAATGCTLLAS